MSPNQKSSSSKVKSEKAKKSAPRQKSAKKATGTNMSGFSFMQRAKDMLSVANEKLHDVVEHMKTRLSEQTEKQTATQEGRVSAARPAMSTSSGKSQSSGRH